MPKLNYASNIVLVGYLHDVLIEYKCDTSVLQVIMEEYQAAHREWVDLSKWISAIFVVEIVKLYIQVKSNLDTGYVGNLSYQDRGPYFIIYYLGHTHFKVKYWWTTYLPWKNKRQTNPISWSNTYLPVNQ